MEWKLENYNEWADQLLEALKGPSLKGKEKNICSLLNEISNCPEANPNANEFITKLFPEIANWIQGKNSQPESLLIIQQLPLFVIWAISHDLISVYQIFAKLLSVKFVMDNIKESVIEGKFFNLLEEQLIKIVDQDEYHKITLSMPDMKIAHYLSNLHDSHSLFLAVKHSEANIDLLVHFSKCDKAFLDALLVQFDEYLNILDGYELPYLEPVLALFFKIIKIHPDPEPILDSFITNLVAEISFYQFNSIPTFYDYAASCIDLLPEGHYKWILIILTSVFLPNFLITRNEKAANFYKLAYQKLPESTALRLFQINIEAIDAEEDFTVSRVSMNILKNLIFMEGARPDLKPEMVKLFPFKKEAITFDPSLGDLLF